MKADDKRLPIEDLLCEATCFRRIGTQGLNSLVRERLQGCGRRLSLGGIPPPTTLPLKKPPPKKAVFCLDSFSVGLHLPVYLHQKINVNILVISLQTCYS